MGTSAATDVRTRIGEWFDRSADGDIGAAPPTLLADYDTLLAGYDIMVRVPMVN